MRTVTLELAGETLEMPVSFAAGSALSKAGIDPLQLALKHDIRASMTSAAVIRVLYIGAEAAGSKLTLEEVGSAVYEVGAIEFLPVAIDYLTAFCAAAPEHPVKAGPKARTPKH
jgi:hypothetical protein